jgi:hypothetical protein
MIIDEITLFRQILLNLNIKLGNDGILNILHALHNYRSSIVDRFMQDTAHFY